MSDLPPAKRLKQSTIFEVFKRQSSHNPKSLERVKIKEGKMSNVNTSPQKRRVDANVLAAVEKRAGFSPGIKNPEPGSSKVVDKEEEPLSQSSMTSSMEINMIGTPELFSDSDPEDTLDHEALDAVGEDITFLGANISAMRTSPGCLPALGELVQTDTHTVLIKTPYRAGDKPLPSLTVYTDKWDANHVKLPCSVESLYPVPETAGGKSLKNRWELIETSLLSEMTSSLDLEEAVLKYNNRYSDKWNFHDLHEFFTEVLAGEEVTAFFKNTLPKMVQLALQLPQLCTQAIPMLRKTMNHSMTLSQEQIACLLANAFFCTFPRRNTSRRQSEYSLYPEINFSRLFQGGKNSRKHVKHEKLKCILNYFRRVTNNMPKGLVTFRRQCLTHFPSWAESEKQLTKLYVSSKGNIENNGQGMLQVDFANKYLGGGVLGHGCVQEEIRFLICPELILSKLFTEELSRNECLIITGFETFSDYSGYADSFAWVGDHVDKTPRDCWGRLCTELVAIDALVFKSYSEQFKENLVIRELNKAYCGFVNPGVPPNNLSAVATGNWGCGAFGGDLRLKALIQLMAASEAGRDVCYFTFDNNQLMHDLHQIHQLIQEKKLAISDVFSLILQYYDSVCRRSQHRKPSLNLYEFVSRVYSGDDTDSTVHDIDENSRENNSKWPKVDSPNYAADTP